MLEDSSKMAEHAKGQTRLLEEKLEEQEKLLTTQKEEAARDVSLPAPPHRPLRHILRHSHRGLPTTFAVLGRIMPGFP